MYCLAADKKFLPRNSLMPVILRIIREVFAGQKLQEIPQGGMNLARKLLSLSLSLSLSLIYIMVATRMRVNIHIFLIHRVTGLFLFSGRTHEVVFPP
jgi:hypothetical protein